jgi:4-azaleucine resistance transporter AzlC
MTLTSPRQEFWHGVRDETPILLGVVPFGLIFGALAINMHLSVAAAQAMSSIVFAGSSQFIAAQMIGAGTSGLVILMVVFVVNLRHALYSASVAPHLRHLKPGWKLLLSYLLTDEAYAVAITHYNRDGDPANRHWYFLGAGLTLTFIALIVPALKDKASVAAALAAGLMGVLAIGLPFRTGLLLAALTGILMGRLVEGRQK